MKHVKSYTNWVNEEATNEMLRVEMAKIYALKDKVAERIKDGWLLQSIENIILAYQLDFGTNYDMILSAIKEKLTRLRRPDAIEELDTIDREIKSNINLGLDSDPDLFD